MFQFKESTTNGGKYFMTWVTLVRERFLAEASSPQTIAMCTIIHEMHVRYTVKRKHVHAVVFTKSRHKEVRISRYLL
jgi:REP element-mobilizing transposase RayT